MFPGARASIRTVPSLLKRLPLQTTRDYRLRRAVLYTPGDDERKIAKTAKLTVDSVIFDCEDGVAANRKQAARETIAKVLNKVGERSPQTDWGVRLNSSRSGFLANDLAAICGGESVPPKTLYLPKVDTTADLDFFVAELEKAAGRRHRLPFDLIVYTESCAAVLNLPALCRHAIEVSRGQQLFRLAGIVFGSDDLRADLGATRTEDGREILYARQRVVLVARAFKLQAIDMVDINLNDLAGLRAQCEAGAAMGYTGKQVIHPKQVAIVQDAFKPNAGLVKWARDVIAAFEQQQETGKGAFSFADQMIDAPTVKQAQNIVDAMDKVEKQLAE